MNRRTEAAYRHVFQYVHDQLFRLNCSSIMSDFEIALRNALRAVSPGIEVRGCWFHFCQALHRQAMKMLDLKNATVKSIVRRLRFLALLPVDIVPVAFGILKEEARNCRDGQLMKFLEYFAKQWLLKVIHYYYVAWWPLSCNKIKNRLSVIHYYYWLQFF